MTWPEAFAYATGALAVSAALIAFFWACAKSPPRAAYNISRQKTHREMNHELRMKALEKGVNVVDPTFALAHTILTQKKKPEEYILCAAIWIKTGSKVSHQPVEDGYVIGGRRHHNCYPAAIAAGETPPIKMSGELSGFLTNKGRYVTRQQAWEIAEAAKQIIHRVGQTPGTLYSEDLY